MMKTQHTMKKAERPNGRVEPSELVTGANQPMRHIRSFLTLTCTILFSSLASSASAATVYNNMTNAPSSNSVVILATTVSGGGSSVEAVQALGLGYDVVINN